MIEWTLTGRTRHVMKWTLLGRRQRVQVQESREVRVGNLLEPAKRRPFIESELITKVVYRWRFMTKADELNLRITSVEKLVTDIDANRERKRGVR